MSNETLQAPPEPIWKRATNWKEVIGLLLLFITPVCGWAWSMTLDLRDTKRDNQQLRKDFDQANLPGEHDRLVRIEQDVSWMRKMWEKEREKP